MIDVPHRYYIIKSEVANLDISLDLLAIPPSTV